MEAEIKKFIVRHFLGMWTDDVRKVAKSYLGAINSNAINLNKEYLQKLKIIANVESYD